MGTWTGGVNGKKNLKIDKKLALNGCNICAKQTCSDKHES